MNPKLGNVVDSKSVFSCSFFEKLFTQSLFSEINLVYQIWENNQILRPGDILQNIQQNLQTQTHSKKFHFSGFQRRDLWGIHAKKCENVAY